MFNWLKKLLVDQEKDLDSMVEAVKVGHALIETENKANQEKSICCCGEYGCEKYEVPVETVSIDLDDDVDEWLGRLVAEGGYVSKQEVIRDALRQALRLEKQATEEDEFLNNVAIDELYVGSVKEPKKIKAVKNKPKKALSKATKKNKKKVVTKK